MPDISGIITQSGVNLEAQAFNTFGAAVATQAGGLLSSIFNSSAVGQSPGLFPLSSNASEPGVWAATPYASAIASGAGGFDPKTKFLFKVTFRFIPDVADEIMTLLGIPNNGQFAAQLTFTIKQIDLPKYKFEYDEVNYYNFRTQILKKVTHDELGFMMYDSVGNHAINFVNAYLQLLVPASRQDYTTGYDLWNHGFAFTQSPAQGNDTGMRGVLGKQGGSINILDVMIIDQYYLSRDASQALRGSSIVNAIKVNSFVFTNPKLTRFDVSDADHEKGSEASMVACGFQFDTLYMQTGQLGVNVAPTRPALVDDLLSGATAGAQGTQVGSGGGNPFLNLFAGQVGRQVAITATQLLGAAGLGNSPGGSVLATAVAGAVGTNAARTIASVGSTAPGIALPSMPVLSDNSQTPSK